MHQTMHRLIGHLFTPLGGQPVLDLTLAAESLGLLQPRWQRRKRRGRHRALFGRGTACTYPQQPFHPLPLLAGQPAAHAVAVHGQLIGCLAAALYPPLADQHQQMQPLLLLDIPRLAQPGTKRL
jgi:hypothetical protein